mmetsp:Transcript_14497/g.28341  ORF Transcript_14497/g.28341 Transcript_14497/m.28341 type:complete len:217 (-) Transcript_14497:248-898(-)|eukprot:CAMPEP_0175157014 /NCGR_PEP_ID=MMETSP0087-20121206/21945_1 /TAXON_ID=136419 /ORGANISM="Unknown Unknown, Strain D1" /LENGTH=216 /DNA_ID=CAMNT_0016444533 /DNA_START=51 /DNA_END=701 /DNA_ORIENTATION=-
MDVLWFWVLSVSIVVAQLSVETDWSVINKNLIESYANDVVPKFKTYFLSPGRDTFVHSSLLGPPPNMIQPVKKINAILKENSKVSKAYGTKFNLSPDLARAFFQLQQQDTPSQSPAKPDSRSSKEKSRQRQPVTDFLAGIVAQLKDKKGKKQQGSGSSTATARPSGTPQKVKNKNGSKRPNSDPDQTKPPKQDAWARMQANLAQKRDKKDQEAPGS